MAPRTLLTSGYGNEINALSFDAAVGSLSKVGTTAVPDAPTWLTLSPTRPVVYTGAEFSEPDGVLHAFTYDEAGTLTPLGGTAQSGAGPVHFALSKDGRYLYTANYGSGSLSTVELDGDGRFVEGSSETLTFKGTGPNKARQEMPHVHGVYVDPTGQYLLAADLGTDVLRVFEISSGKPSALPSITLPPGNGPRHLVISPPDARSSRTLIYLIEELSNTIAVFEAEYPGEKQGAFNLKEIQREVSVLPPDAKDTPGDWTAAELALSPSGAFLYATNRSPVDNPAPYDTLTIFPVGADGSLLAAQAKYFNLDGRGPRHFALSPEGRFLAVPLERTSEVVVYEVPEGREDELHEVARLKGVDQPTCIAWLS
ncbi:hypothetical protein JCM10450v2_003103 [Rhodotorula kratochvilovae]